MHGPVLDYSQPHADDPLPPPRNVLCIVGFFSGCIGWFHLGVGLVLEAIHGGTGVIVAGIGGFFSVVGILIVLCSVCIGPARRNAALLLALQVLVVAVIVYINTRSG